MAVLLLDELRAHHCFSERLVGDPNLRKECDRIKLNSTRFFSRLKGKIYRHCQSYVRTLGLDTQRSVDKTSDLSYTIQKNALAKINSYYEQEELAAPEQLHEAVDEAIKNIEPRMPLLFAEEAAVGHNS